MKKSMVTLKCITNLHAGNGDVNYNIIDNEVEKDSVTGYPVINSSGVKGALRAYLGDESDVSNKLFGAAEGKKQGELKILTANILAIPLRASKGSKAYYMVTTDNIVKQYEAICKNLDIQKELMEETAGEEKICVEGYSAKIGFKYKGEDIYVIKDSELRNIALPTLARNKLDNGISKNLWYEEVVPHESIFYFPVISDTDDAFSLFKDSVDGKVIQFGGSASIGYGLCKVSLTKEA